MPMILPENPSSDKPSEAKDQVFARLFDGANVPRAEPATAKATAAKLLSAGFHPIAIHPGAKRPIGTGWGLDRPTVDELNATYTANRGAGVGVVLGPGKAPGGLWLIDLEGDGPEAEESLLRLMGGECVETRGWTSKRGSHRLFIAPPDFLDRIRDAGGTERKGAQAGAWHLDEFPDLEFRIGGYKLDGTIKQFQSVAPPTETDGVPRRWNPCRTLATIPSCALDLLLSIAVANAKPKPSPQPEPAPQSGRWTTTTGDGAASHANYVRTAVDLECKAVAGEPVNGGNRNNRLNDAAHALGTLVGARVLPRWEAEGRLMEAAAACSYVATDGEQAARDTIASGLNAGELKPRDMSSIGTRTNGNGQANGQAADAIRIDPADEAGDIENAEIIDRWPKLDPHALYGPIGEYVRRVDPETEADPVAVALQAMAGFGNLIGRGPHYVVGTTKHFTVLNVMVVGDTAVGRKGTSGDVAEHLLEKIDPSWAATRCRNGLVSGEGLIHQVRDPTHRKPTKEEIRRGAFPSDLILDDEGVQDKRLFVVETEFARALKAMGRDTNTLSEVIRQTFDGKTLSNMAKNSGNIATGAHVSIIGHITRADVRKFLSETDMLNGFGNRFLWIAARRSKLLPDGGEVHGLDLADVVADLARARKFAMGFGCARMTFDDDFRSIWRSMYPQLSSSDRHVMAARSEAYVKRLACIYALLDITSTVGERHLEAALALWEYVETSIGFVFGAASKDPNEIKLVKALAGSPGGLTRKEITCDVFQKHLRADALASLLSDLWTRRVIHRKSEASTGGRPAERWFLDGEGGAL